LSRQATTPTACSRIAALVEGRLSNEKEILMWRRFAVIALLALVASSCGDSGTMVPPETLVGTWNATSVELVSVGNPAVRVDLVADLGATVTLVLEANNDFTLTVTYAGDEPGRPPWGANSMMTGTWSATDILTLQTSPTSQWQFETDLNGDVLSLTEADTSFDFGADGTLEDADLSLDLTRAGSTSS
jgi:hypothetical protein